MSLCRENLVGRFIKTNAKKVDIATSRLNAQISTEGGATLNDFYDLLGLDPTEVGAVLGWEAPVTIRFSSDLDKKFKPFLTFSYYPQPGDIRVWRK